VGDSIKIIGEWVFHHCYALRFIRLSKTLECMGERAFYRCDSLEVLFLPSTVKSIGYKALSFSRSLTLVILPNDIKFRNICFWIIDETVIHQIARAAAWVATQFTSGCFITWTMWGNEYSLLLRGVTRSIALKVPIEATLYYNVECFDIVSPSFLQQDIRMTRGSIKSD